MRSERLQGLILVLVSAAGYAFLPIFARNIYNSAPDFQPTDIAVWRFTFATPIIWLVIALRQTPTPPFDRRLRIGLFGLGFLFAAAALSAFASLERVPASVYVVLFYTYPAMVALIALLRGERLSLRAWLAVGLTLVGVYFTVPDFNAGDTDIIGLGMALVNALVVALYFVINSTVLRGSRAMARSTAWIIGSALVILLAFTPFFGLNIPPNGNTWGLLLGLSIFSTVIPIFAINLGIQKIGAPQAAIISSVEPIGAIFLSVILLGEVVIGAQWFGAILIVGAVLLLQIPRRPKKTFTSRT